LAPTAWLSRPNESSTGIAWVTSSKSRSLHGALSVKTRDLAAFRQPGGKIIAGFAVARHAA
jgi:hypothetical protein